MEEYKAVGMTIEYSYRNSKSQVLIKHEANIYFGSGTPFSDISEFLHDVNRILTAYKACIKNCIYCKVNLDAYRAPDVNLDCFDAWSFEGIPEDKEGLYLSPDTRYTDMAHDIYIDFSQLLLEQLAEAHI